MNITRLANDGDHQVATNGEITVKVDFVRPGSPVQWLSDLGWQSTPYQSVNFNTVEDAVVIVAEWLDGQW